MKPLIKNVINKRRKILTFISIVFLFVFLILSSEVIYLFNNRPGTFGIFFLYFARKDVEKGQLHKAINKLDMAANLYLKENKIKYPDKIEVSSIDTKLDNLNSDTNDILLKFLTDAFSKTKNKNYETISNTYYNAGLLLYNQGDHELANSFLSSSVLLDPTLSFLHVELADSYFNDDKFEEGMKALNYCLIFDQPRKHCQDYIDINVKSKSFNPLGYFKKIIDNSQQSL